jgi:GMP synthase (glutamine-hydrolysing)
MNIKSGLERDDDRPVLIVLHQETSTPGRAGQMLEQKGFRLDIRRPVLGQALPDTLADHAGAIIFGGPMSANDTDDYVKREIDWINVPLSENRSFLGICLGAQMLVKTLGGKVESHPDGLTEIGWYPLEETEEGRKLIAWPKWSTISTARVSTCRAAGSCSRAARPMRTRPYAMATMPGASSSTANSHG